MIYIQKELLKLRIRVCKNLHYFLFLFISTGHLRTEPLDNHLTSKCYRSDLWSACMSSYITANRRAFKRWRFHVLSTTHTETVNDYYHFRLYFFGHSVSASVWIQHQDTRKTSKLKWDILFLSLLSSCDLRPQLCTILQEATKCIFWKLVNVFSNPASDRHNELIWSAHLGLHLF